MYLNLNRYMWLVTTTLDSSNGWEAHYFQRQSLPSPGSFDSLQVPPYPAPMPVYTCQQLFPLILNVPLRPRRSLAPSPAE